MKRGFLSKQYDSGRTLAITPSTSATTAATTATTAATSVPKGKESDLEDPSRIEDSNASLSALAELLNEMSLLSDKDNAPPLDPIPDKKDMVDEFIRQVRSSGNIHVKNITLHGRITTGVIFLDQQSKEKFTKQLLPYEYTEQFLTNLLSTQYNARSGTSSVVKTGEPAGQLLLLEYPIICAPAVWLDAGSGATTSFEDILRMAVGALAPERQAQFMSLFNAWNGYVGPDTRGQGALTGIFNTNAIKVDILDNQKILYAGVFDMFSRLNHSCRPNAYWNWDMSSATMNIRAIVPLAAGDEVNISYIGMESLLRPAATRRAELRQGYRFTCMCSACDGPSADVAASDARRAELARTPAPRRRLFLVWVRGAGTDSFLIDKSLRACELYDREQLYEPDEGPERWTHSVQLMYCYLALGKAEESILWAQKVLLRALIMRQDDPSSILRDADRIVKSPRSSPLWDARATMKGPNKSAGVKKP